MKKGKTLIFARSGSNPQDFSTTKGIYSMDNLDTPESRFEAAVKKLNLEPDAAPFGSGGLFPDRTPRNTDKTPRYSETLTGFDRLAVPDKTPRYGDGFTPRHSKKRSKTFVGFPEAQEPAAEEPPTIQEERVIQYIKLYKVEKKNKDELANINKELEIRMIRDQRLIADFQELLETINPDTIDNKKLELMKKQLDKRKTHLEKLNNLRPGLTSDKDFDIDDDDDKIIKMARNTSLDLEVLDAPPEPTIEEIQVETKKDVASNKPIAQISKAISRIAQVNEKKNSPANNIIFKLRHNFQKKLLKMKTVFPIKSVLKQISGIYVERATAVKDTPSIRDMDMASFVYKQFINMYGFQKFAIDKLVKFVVSVRKHSIVPRIFKFAKLVGLMDELQNYSFYEAKQYLLGMEYFNNTTTSGQNYIGADADKSHYIVWSKIFDYTRIFGEKKLTPIELQDFRKDLEKLKQKDPTSKNDRYIVDVDEFLERLIVKYRTLVNRNKDIVRVAFKGGLISHETRMKFIDFYNLFKYMEPEKFEDKKVEDVFINQSDMVEGEDVSLSFEKFVGICYELDICSEQKIKNFIGISNEREVNDRFEELKSRWADEHIRLNEMMLQKKSTVSNEVLTYWRTGLESINNSFVYTESEAEKKYILIRMKIIHLDIFNTF